MAARGAICLLLVTLTLRGSQCNTRYFMKMRTNASELVKPKGGNTRVLNEPIMATQSPLHRETKPVFQDDGQRMIKDYPRTEDDSKNGFETSTFNPDVLNKFLEEYASKIKGSTEKYQRYPFRIVKPAEAIALEVDDPTTSTTTVNYDQDTKYEVDTSNSTSTEDGVRFHFLPLFKDHVCLLRSDLTVLRPL